MTTSRWMRTPVCCGVALLACLWGCSRGIDQQKFAGVYKVGQDMQRATGGFTLVQYREVLDAFAGEVERAKGDARIDKEREMVRQYDLALNCYRDAAIVWGAKAQHGSTLRTELLPDGSALIARYNLGLHPDPNQPQVQVLYLEEAMPAIWQRAEQAMAAADAIYTGKSK